MFCEGHSTRGSGSDTKQNRQQQLPPQHRQQKKMESSTSAATAASDAVDDGKPFQTENSGDVTDTEKETSTSVENGTAAKSASTKKRASKKKARDHGSSLNDEADTPQLEKVVQVFRKKSYDRVERTYDSDDSDADENGSQMYEEVCTQKYDCRSVISYVPKPLPEQPVKKAKRAHTAPKKKDGESSLAADYAENKKPDETPATPSAEVKEQPSSAVVPTVAPVA